MAVHKTSSNRWVRFTAPLSASFSGKSVKVVDAEGFVLHRLYFPDLVAAVDLRGCRLAVATYDGSRYVYNAVTGILFYEDHPTTPLDLAMTFPRTLAA